MVEKNKNIVYASDEKFAEILAVSMESLLQHNSKVSIYVLNNNMSQESIEKLIRQAQRHNTKIKFMPLKDLKNYAGRELSCQGKISKTAYFRLFMPQIIPNNVDKLLYLDCDTIVMENLDALFSYPLVHSCGAVIEPTAKLMKEKIELTKEDTYFNSGVLLVDLKKWREDKLTDKFIKFIEKMNGEISFEDQGVINHVLKGKIDILPIRYNVETQYFDFGFDGFQLMKRDEIRYSKNEVELAIKTPAIVHFTNSFASERPWVRGTQHKYVNMWKEMKAKTEWSESPEWKSHKDFVRRSSRRIYEMLPGKLKFHFIYFANGIVRAILS